MHALRVNLFHLNYYAKLNIYYICLLQAVNVLLVRNSTDVYSLWSHFTT